MGSPTSSALETVVASDARITALQLEVELLEADAEGSTADAAALPPAPASQQTSPHLQPPPAGATGGGEPSSMVSELRQEIAKLSLEDKAARLAEAYEDLDVLVSKTSPHKFALWLSEKCQHVAVCAHQEGCRIPISMDKDERGENPWAVHAIDDTAVHALFP